MVVSGELILSGAAGAPFDGIYPELVEGMLRRVVEGPPDTTKIQLVFEIASTHPEEIQKC